MISVTTRGLLSAMALLIATAGHAELRDLGRYGPTCPVRDAPPSRVGQRVRVDPALAHVSSPVEPSMPLAPAQRTYSLPGRWPAGAPSIIAFVGQDTGSLATVRTLPSGTPVFVLPSEGATGLAALRQACPACRIGIAGPAGARRLGIQAVPTVIRAADGVAHVTEGPP
jgi:hypothetical protein